MEGCHCKELLLLKKTVKVSELFTAATPAWRGKRSSPIQQPSAPPTDTDSPAQQGYYYTQEGFPNIGGPQSRAEARWVVARSRPRLRAEAPALAKAHSPLGPGRSRRRALRSAPGWGSSQCS